MPLSPNIGVVSIACVAALVALDLYAARRGAPLALVAKPGPTVWVAAEVALRARRPALGLLAAAGLCLLAYGQVLSALSPGSLLEYLATSLAYLVLVVRVLADEARMQAASALPYALAAAISGAYLWRHSGPAAQAPVLLQCCSLFLLAWRLACCGLRGRGAKRRDLAGSLLILATGLQLHERIRPLHLPFYDDVVDVAHAVAVLLLGAALLLPQRRASSSGGAAKPKQA